MTTKSHSESPAIPRLDLPPEGLTSRGWGLYENDRWHGPAPMDWDERGWRVYPDKATAFLGLACELRQRCELFHAGQLSGESLACTWYPVEVTYLPDGCARDDSGAEFAPGEPW